MSSGCSYFFIFRNEVTVLIGKYSIPNISKNLDLAIIDVYDSGSPGGFQKHHLTFHNLQKLNIVDMTSSADEKRKCKPSSHTMTCAATAAGKPLRIILQGKRVSVVTKTLLTQKLLHQMSVIFVKLDDSDCLDSNMEQNSLTEALHHVRDNKFDVVSSMSFTGECKKDYFQYHVSELHTNNVVVVAAAGN